MTFAVAKAQSAPNYTKLTLAAGVAATAVPAGKWIAGVRMLNWTASPVYVAPGEAGTPASGAPSDFIPAAVGGVPGQYEPPFVTAAGLRAVGAGAGDLTVIIW